MSIRDRMAAYFALHSYSQLILMPWGYTSTLPVAYWDMEDKAKKARERLHRRYGTEYSVGSSTNVLCRYFLLSFLKFQLLFIINFDTFVV